MKYSIENRTPYEFNGLVDLMHMFVPYAQEYLKFDKPVTIDLVSDLKNAKNPLGRTASYEPGKFKIIVYVDDRHTKDILRSLSHELVHHAQNCRGEFDDHYDTGPGYIKRDSHMQNMEGEAYLLGNGFIIRFFEEYVKKSGTFREATTKEKVKMLNEQQEDQEAQETTEEEVLDDFKPESIKAYRRRRKKIIGDELMRRWVKKSAE